MAQLRFFVATGDAVTRVVERDGAADVRLSLEGSGAQCIAVDPHDPNRVFVGTFDQGLWRSGDGGESWERVGEGNRGIAESRVLSVAVSPSDRPGGVSTVFAGTEPSLLYRSDDDGKSWHASSKLTELPSAPGWSFPPRPWTHHVRWIAPHHTDPALVFVGIELGGVMRSHDGGETWEDRKPGSYHDSHAVLTHPTAADRVYEAAGEGVAFSSDGGDTWRPVDAGKERRYTVGLAVDPVDPDLWYVSAASGPGAAYRTDGQSAAILYRKRGESPWEAVTGNGVLAAPNPLMPIALLTFPGQANLLLAGFVNGEIALTEDAGDTWRRLALKLPHLMALSAA